MDDDNLINGMNDYYDRRAPIHDERMSYESNKQLEALFEPIIALLKPFVAGKDILEIACGTGNWTQILAKRARSVLATDVNQSTIDIARQKEYSDPPPRFVEADAYKLETIDGEFDTVFMADWWAHIPKSKLSQFLDNLHLKLRESGCVVVVDILPYDLPDDETERFDDDGNRIHQRTLPDGGSFSVVKNYPSRQELVETISPYADEFHYWQIQALKRWVLIYRLR
jgi:ubiquinone/menaquinone biosynthesis C-methylase UbiE